MLMRIGQPSKALPFYRQAPLSSSQPGEQLTAWMLVTGNFSLCHVVVGPFELLLQQPLSVPPFSAAPWQTAPRLARTSRGLSWRSATEPWTILRVL